MTDAAFSTAINRAVVFRLYPTTAQAEQLAQIAGACRFLYNLALEQRRVWSRPGRHITMWDAAPALTAPETKEDAR